MLSQVLPLFLAPLLATASPVALATREPSANETQTCFARTSAIPHWEVSDFDFHASYTFSTPSHQNSWGYVSFALTNPVLGTTTECSASSSRLNDFFYGDLEYECDETEGDGESEGGEPNLAGTEFTYDRPSGELRVEQSWYCYDEPQFPSTITAKGNESTSLVCEEEFWENENWTIGEVYSQRDVKCDLVSFEVPVKEISAIA